jgi:hypothetical protein
MPKTMAHTMLHKLHLLLCVHNASEPDLAEWESYIADFRRLDVTQARQLVFTEGGGPNTKQRDQINQHVQGRAHRVAVVTNNGLVRSICTALSWFNPNVKAFTPSNIATAFNHINISPEEARTVMAAVRTLRGRLGDTALSCIPASL